MSRRPIEISGDDHSDSARVAAISCGPVLQKGAAFDSQKAAAFLYQRLPSVAETEKAHAHRGWLPIVINNAQYKVISRSLRAMCKHKSTKNKHKIQLMSYYIMSLEYILESSHRRSSSNV